jgi:hypothetical protein
MKTHHSLSAFQTSLKGNERLAELSVVNHSSAFRWPSGMRMANAAASVMLKAAILAGTTLAVTPSAQAQYGPYTCANGLVWREAVPNDLVCVNSAWRQKTRDENAIGPSRRQPGGGAYGPDTCRQGYVWRETRPTDHVCVPPRSRSDNRRSNKNAHTGYARPEQLPSNSTSARWDNEQLLVHPPHLAYYGLEPGKPLRTFGSYGMVYGARGATPRRCRNAYDRFMIVLAVDEVTGLVSNAGRVNAPLCM